MFKIYFRPFDNGSLALSCEDTLEQAKEISLEERYADLVVVNKKLQDEYNETVKENIKLEDELHDIENKNYKL